MLHDEPIEILEGFAASLQRPGTDQLLADANRGCARHNHACYSSLHSVYAVSYANAPRGEPDPPLDAAGMGAGSGQPVLPGPGESVL